MVFMKKNGISSRTDFFLMKDTNEVSCNLLAVVVKAKRNPEMKKNRGI